METTKSASRQTLRDYSLIEQALAGSQQAYRILFKRYWRQLYFTVNKIIPDREKAKDIAIESFSKAFGNLHRFRPDYSFSTWLYRVAINHSLDHLRKRRLPTTPLSTFDLDDSSDFFTFSNDKDRQPFNPEELVIQWQKKIAVERNLHALPPVLQDFARMRFVEGYTYEEIAKCLLVPVGTVKARIHRARYLLQESLQPLRNHL